MLVKMQVPGPHLRPTESEWESSKSALQSDFQVTLMYNNKVWKAVFYGICVFALTGKFFASIYACGNIAYPYSPSFPQSTCPNSNRHDLFCCCGDGKHGETSWLGYRGALGSIEIQQPGWRWLEGIRICILKICALELRLQKFGKHRTNQQQNYIGQISN